MAKRSVRRQRRMESANSHTPIVTSPVPPQCEAEGCIEFPLEQVFMAELNRKVSVCPTHGRLLRIQIERNENVAQGRADFDRKELARRLGA